MNSKNFNFEKLPHKSNTNSISSNISHGFGPQAKIHKIEINKKIKKLIHYDCNNYDLEGIDDDIPDEDEVYIKENLLNKKREEIITE